MFDIPAELMAYLDPTVLGALLGVVLGAAAASGWFRRKTDTERAKKEASED